MFGADGVFRAMRSGDKVSWGQPARLAPVESPAAAGASPWDGVPRYTSVRPLHGFPLFAMVALDRDEQLVPFAKRGRTYLWVAAIASVLLILIVTLVCVWSWQLTRTQRRIRRAQETFAAASEASLDAFLVMRSVRDAGGAIVDFCIEATNGRAQQLTGMGRDALIGTTILTIMPSYRENGIFDDMVAVATIGGMREAEWRGETARTRDTWMHRQVVAVEDGVVAIVRDITERKLAEQRIRHMAHHDDLTGLPNRSLIRDRLDHAILHAQRNGRCVAVAFIDLDSFKLVNDGLGHNAGDELLKVVGARMHGCVRRGDTVGRFGGDEFVIILTDLGEDALSITPVLEKIRQAVTETVLLEGQEVQVSCSMGVVMYPRDGADPNTLMMNADAAMYRAKEMGNNNFQFYTREMNASVEQKLVLLEGLRNALDDQQFSLLYQPKVDLRSGLIFGVEALIRWHHPEHGMIAPQRFIGLAEESGLIVAIGDWVLQTACRQNMAWRAAGLAPINMSVNVSPRQFEDKRLVERVAQALGRQRAAGRIARTGSDREPDHARPGASGRQDGRTEGDGRVAVDRRFRHRLLEPVGAQVVPDQQPEDRQVVRQRTGRQPRRPGHRDGGHLAWPQAEPARHRRRRRDRTAVPLPARQRLRRDAGLPVQPPAAARRSRRDAAGPGPRAGRADRTGVLRCRCGISSRACSSATTRSCGACSATGPPPACSTPCA